jgi:hypothetical protein
VKRVRRQDEGGATWLQAFVHGDQERHRRRDVLEDIARDDDVEVVTVRRGELLEGRLKPLVQPVIGQDPGGGIHSDHVPHNRFQPPSVVLVTAACPDIQHNRVGRGVRCDHLVKNVELVGATCEQHGLRPVRHCHRLPARVAI